MDSERPIIASPLRELEGNARFDFMLRNDDEFVRELARALASEADPETSLDAVVELAGNVAAWWIEHYGHPGDSASAAADVVLELRKIWDGEVAELKQLGPRPRPSSRSSKPRRDPSKTKKRTNRTKAKAKRKAARKARKRK